MPLNNLIGQQSRLLIENGDTLALVRIERIKYANYLIDISQQKVDVYEEMIVNYDVQVESLLDMLKNRGEVIAAQDTIIQAHVDINITQQEIIQASKRELRRQKIITYIITGSAIILLIIAL